MAATDRRRALRRALALVVALGAFAAGVAADEISGTWTGQAELWGNYYWERSTRVVAPEVKLRLDAPNGLQLRGAYLVDAITSASQAAGALVDVRFTEVRHQGTVGAGGEIDLGTEQLRIDGNFRVSREPDYLSIGSGVNASLALAERNTILSAGLQLVHDEVRQNFRTGSQTRPDAMGGMGSASFDENLDAFVLHLGLEQVLTPRLLFTVGYDLGYMNGYLANPYRQVSVAGTLVPERHPGIRRRHTLTGRLAYYIPATKSAVHLLYRAYLDSWHIGAINPEVRLYQELGPYVQIRLRYRHYRQSAAFFYKADSDDYSMEDAFVSADPKMSRFHSNLGGFQLSVSGGFLEDTALHALRRVSGTLLFDYIWNTNRFGNGVIAQAGLIVPF